LYLFGSEPLNKKFDLFKAFQFTIVHLICLTVSQINSKNVSKSLTHVITFTLNSKDANELKKFFDPFLPPDSKYLFGQQVLSNSYYEAEG